MSAATTVGNGPAVMVDAITSEDSKEKSTYTCFYLNFHILGPDTRPTMFTSSTTSTTITFTWGPPNTSNGMIIQYRLQCSDGRQVHIENVTGSQTTTTLSGLLPYTSYSCIITAHTSVGGGPPAAVSVTTEQDGEQYLHVYSRSVLFYILFTVPSGPPLNLTISVHTTDYVTTLVSSTYC